MSEEEKKEELLMFQFCRSPFTQALAPAQFPHTPKATPVGFDQFNPINFALNGSFHLHMEPGQHQPLPNGGLGFVFLPFFF